MSHIGVVATGHKCVCGGEAMTTTITVPRDEVAKLVTHLLDHTCSAENRAGFAAGTLEYWLFERQTPEVKE